MRARFIETMTWPEAEQALQEQPVVMLPLGARTKEHGHHLPLNNDWIMAEYLTKRVMARVPVLVLPTLQYGFYPAFVEYPGSVNIRFPTSRDMIIDVLRSFARHGARKFYILNTGISTLRVLRAVREQLSEDGCLVEYTNLKTAKSDVTEKLREQEGGTHADELETSMMLYMAPEIVRMERAEKDYHEEQKPGPLRRTQPVESGIYSPTGAWGDPTLASREKGALLSEALVDHIVDFLERFRQEDFQPDA